MNEFFKYLIPKLLEYFNNDRALLNEFLPKVIGNYYNEGINNDENLNVQENRKKA